MMDVYALDILLCHQSASLNAESFGLVSEDLRGLAVVEVKQEIVDLHPFLLVVWEEMGSGEVSRVALFKCVVDIAGVSFHNVPRLIDDVAE